MASKCAGPKTSWPELNGVEGSIAKATIEKENPNVHVILVWPVMEAASSDLDCTRVLVILDYHGHVVGTPKVG
ncbi:hypothetical protein J5N97_010644 [Dioscorea zingiberensis]|uniref:Uncharacterized protein n=1 Tax=Dioscorea zingiberensis TaxID=325984 RepID=A0A9D5D0K5_9LILI|nr:hypothetical protein J5N97_010644 [Dioscorea zingiberensis]